MSAGFRLRTLGALKVLMPGRNQPTADNFWLIASNPGVGSQFKWQVFALSKAVCWCKLTWSYNMGGSGIQSMLSSSCGTMEGGEVVNQKRDRKHVCLYLRWLVGHSRMLSCSMLNCALVKDDLYCGSFSCLQLEYDLWGGRGGGSNKLIDIRLL